MGAYIRRHVGAPFMGAIDAGIKPAATACKDETQAAAADLLEKKMSSQSFLIFSLGEEHFAIDASIVREIIWLPEVTPIEEAPDYIVGVINLRGKIAPVADLNLRFGHPRKRYHITDNVIVIEKDGFMAGFGCGGGIC